jgi:hypothetical protein
VFIGADAWKHLEGTAGPTMGRFLKKYVHEPIAALVGELPDEMPEMILNMTDDLLTVSIDGEEFSIPRSPARSSEVEEIDDQMPEDADDEIGS